MPELGLRAPETQSVLNLAGAWGTLLPWQERVITWHAGQTYAIADLKELGIARFSKSYDPDEKPTDSFKWNAYVRGSIAFLEHNRAELQKARDEMFAANPADTNVNVKVLDGFLNCFDKTYAEAYGNACRSPQKTK